MIEAAMPDKEIGQLDREPIVKTRARIDQRAGLLRHRLHKLRGGVSEAVDGPSLNPFKMRFPQIVVSIAEQSCDSTD